MKSKITVIFSVLFLLTLAAFFQNCEQSRFGQNFVRETFKIHKESEGNGGGYTGLQIKGVESIESGQTALFHLSGGNPPYKAEIISGRGRIVQIDENNVGYQTDLLSIDEEHTLRFSDSGTGEVSWNIRVTKVVAADLRYGDQFGFRAQILGDTLVVCSPGTDQNGANSGGAYIAEKTGDKWLIVKKLVAADSKWSRMGASMHFSGDQLIMGGPDWDPDPIRRQDGTIRKIGAAFVFEKINGVFNNNAQILTPKDLPENTQFGQSVLIDGNLAFVGARNETKSSVYVFKKTTDGWIQIQQIIPQTALKWFGYRLQYVNGNLLISSRSEQLKGKVFIYKHQLDDRFLQLAEVTQQLGSTFTRFGENFKLLNDVLWITEIGPGYRLTLHEYKFSNETVSFVKTHHLSPDFASVPGNISFAMNENYLLLGVPLENINDVRSAGAVYLFEKSADSWGFLKRLTAEQPKDLDNFGFSLGLSGTRAVISSPGTGNALILELGP